MNEPANNASVSAARRATTPVMLRLTYSRETKKNATTATGFHSSSVSVGAMPSAVSPPEITIPG